MLKRKIGAGSPLHQRIALAVALAMAVIPILNKLPQIGPLDVEIYRASVLALCAVVIVLARPFAAQFPDNGAMRALALALDAAALAAILYACWRFYVDLAAMRDTVSFFEPHQAWSTFALCLAVLYLTWRNWGLPLAVVGALALAYFLWSFRDTLVDDLPESMWLALDDGILGNITAIVLSTVFPFIILGAMLEGAGAGGSLIKVAFYAMRRFRGGPAHAAILSSAMFGSVSGSAISNVVGTGVITIPLIKQRGFSANFAGGVEATASTGGQIMPPVMGAAAIVMSDYIGVSYLTIIVAALVPAIFYYLSLFMATVFESRRLGIEASEEIADDLKIGRQDYLNLILIFAPIAAILVAMIVGYSTAAAALIAIAVLIVLSVIINPAVRRNPLCLVQSFAEGAMSFAFLLIAICTVSMVVAATSSTGLPTQLALLLSHVNTVNLFLALLMASVCCMLLGMGMPTMPAYLTIILVMGSTFRQFGLEPLSAHMFVLYYAVASGITPPVAMTAYAAATISGGNPTKTGFAAMRIGAVIFVLPFFWAYNPIMLVVPESGAIFTWGEFALATLRLLAMCYMLASAVSRFDLRRMRLSEAALRAAIGFGLIAPDPLIWGASLALSLGIVALHWQTGRRAVAAGRA